MHIEQVNWIAARAVVELGISVTRYCVWVVSLSDRSSQ